MVKMSLEACCGPVHHPSINAAVSVPQKAAALPVQPMSEITQQ